MSSGTTDRNQEATVYVGNLDDRVTEALLWELFVQVGPVVHVHIPKDRISMNQQNYGFVEFSSEIDADYAVKVMNMIKLFNKSIRVNKASADKKSSDVGANLFIGHLDPEIDEKQLYDIFGAFGNIIQVKVVRDDIGMSKGFAFLHYDSFDASDAALQAMDGQYIRNQAITISYAFKKGPGGTITGERHGTTAERLLAAQLKLTHMNPQIAT